VSAVFQQVSSPTESLILVNDTDEQIGFCSKLECHQGEGLLHRAFSVFIFNREGQLLLQQRSAQKPLWPLYWSNSCCSHPHEAESIEDAGRRRLREELDLQCELEFLYKFQYQANFDNLGAENEFCHVFAGYTDGDVRAHPDEIAAWRYISPEELTREIAEDGDRFTPWMKMEWQRIQADFLNDILGRCKKT
jgi:isopentenyl-diphosphate delta-isomerase